MTWATCTIHLTEHSASDGCPICRTNAENDRLRADRPIIFSGPMVRALLDGRKTQTRRGLKKTQSDAVNRWFDKSSLRLPYAPGDRLYVREAFAMNPAVRHPDRVKNVIHRADCPDKEPPAGDVLTMDRLLWAEARELKWKPSIHMPRWASRLTLTVTDVRVQRLGKINRGDAMAEGCPFPNMANGPDPRDWFRDLWGNLHGPEAWDANPWVVALTFTVSHGNIDQVRP